MCSKNEIWRTSLRCFTDEKLQESSNDYIDDITLLRKWVVFMGPTVNSRIKIPATWIPLLHTKYEVKIVEHHSMLCIALSANQLIAMIVSNPVGHGCVHNLAPCYSHNQANGKSQFTKPIVEYMCHFPSISIQPNLVAYGCTNIKRE